MPTVDIMPEDQRRILHDLVALHTPRPEDAIKSLLVDAVEVCLSRDELALGMALVALIAARGAEVHHRAASQLWELVEDHIRRGETPAAPHTP